MAFETNFGSSSVRVRRSRSAKGLRDPFEDIASVRDDSSAAIFGTVCELVENATDDDAETFRRLVGGASDDSAGGILYKRMGDREDERKYFYVSRHNWVQFAPRHSRRRHPSSAAICRNSHVEVRACSGLFARCVTDHVEHRSL